MKIKGYNFEYQTNHLDTYASSCPLCLLSLDKFLLPEFLANEGTKM